LTESLGFRELALLVKSECGVETHGAPLMFASTAKLRGGSPRVARSCITL
jgi:hypothetical protein